MKVVDKISVAELQEMAQKMYDPMVKAVVDINKKIMVVDGEMHVDEESHLLENGSRQQDLWGINLWPGNYGTEKFIEFDSMINIRPSQNNRSRDVEDTKIRNEISIVVSKVVYE